MRIRERFNPRAPCGARRGGRNFNCPLSVDFNPRAPCGARQLVNQRGHIFAGISTHAPLAGRDHSLFSFPTMHPLFQPTRPLRGATTPEPHSVLFIDISTHAPLAGRDPQQMRYVVFSADFNPRAPCGARQQKCTNRFAHFCDNRQISDAFAQNAACQGILLLFDAGKPCGFWVRTAQVISARLCFAL